MSTKKLDKTAIEGGRINGYKYERKQSLRSARRGVKQILQSVRDYEDFYEVEFPEREKSSYWPSEKFKDKLSPVYRWIDKRVGMPWDETYSLMRKRFDARTTPGRHILFDHMLGQVWRSQDHTTEESDRYEYYVDGYGILRKNENYRTRYQSQDWVAIRAERERISDWLGGRLIGKVGNVLYWFEPVRPIPSTVRLRWTYNADFGYVYFSQGSWYCWYTSFRQGGRLKGPDVEYFSKLHERNKEVLLDNSPLLRKYSGLWYGSFY